VQEYKGVDNLLTAFAAMPDGVRAHLTVAGQCDDQRLRSLLHALARPSGDRVALRLEWVPVEEVTNLVAAADVIVLPFRRVTTSGSAMLGLAHGRPLIVPDLAGLADLPGQAVLRYDGEIRALTAALTRLALVDSKTLAAMSAAALDYASGRTWQESAEKTMAEMISLLEHSASSEFGQLGQSTVE
jgi:glycosyltransferase involved in cell wall biosynthesis